MRSLLLILGLASLQLVARAQSTNSFPLWPDGAPGALGTADKDIPTLTVFLPDPAKATGAAMVICPGGGYAHLAPSEGQDYARFFNAHGIAGFVLKYRLATGGYHYPAMFQDVTRAMRTVRARAGEWKVDPHRIGIIGSSAGGHLASTLLTHFDAGDPKSSDIIERQSSRPDLGVLCYGVLTLGPYTHHGSKVNLLGTNPPPDLVNFLSNEKQVTPQTPPCFIWHTYEDKTVPMENSIEFAMALRKAGVPFDLHIYEKGRHGLGLGSREYDPSKFLPWTRDCIYWLKIRGFVK